MDTHAASSRRVEGTNVRSGHRIRFPSRWCLWGRTSSSQPFWLPGVEAGKCPHGLVDPVNHAKLNVVFDQWAAKLVAFFTSSEEGNYWILRVDPDYQLAIVGTPDLDYLWILSRTPTLDETAYEEAVAFCRNLGFETEHLIRPSR